MIQGKPVSLTEIYAHAKVIWNKLPEELIKRFQTKDFVSLVVFVCHFHADTSVAEVCPICLFCFCLIYVSRVSLCASSLISWLISPPTGQHSLDALRVPDFHSPR